MGEKLGAVLTQAVPLVLEPAAVAGYRKRIRRPPPPNIFGREEYRVWSPDDLVRAPAPHALGGRRPACYRAIGVEQYDCEIRRCLGENVQDVSFGKHSGVVVLRRSKRRHTTVQVYPLEMVMSPRPVRLSALVQRCAAFAEPLGSSFTAELGSMKMREEIDAIRVMGLNPIDVLILPRVIALIVALPLLTFVADMARAELHRTGPAVVNSD